MYELERYYDLFKNTHPRDSSYDVDSGMSYVNDIWDTHPRWCQYFLETILTKHYVGSLVHWEYIKKLFFVVAATMASHENCEDMFQRDPREFSYRTWYTNLFKKIPTRGELHDLYYCLGKDFIDESLNYCVQRQTLKNREKSLTNKI